MGQKYLLSFFRFSDRSLKNIKRNKAIFVVGVLVLASAFLVGPPEAAVGSDQSLVTEEIVSEESQKPRGIRSLGSALLFLGSSTYQVEAEENEALGGLAGEDSSDLETAGGSALVAQTPVLNIVSADEPLSKEELTYTYEVESGDNLSMIAQDFGLSLDTLLWANDLSTRSILRPGDRLVILPVDGVTHTVSRGDTISTIAAKYKAEASEVLVFNNLSESAVITAGQVLVIPGGSPHVPVSPRVVPDTPIHSLVEAGSGYYVIPTRGRITQGLHRYNAIDVGGSAYCNTSVYASAPGTIIEVRNAGWNGGYGKYIKINHPNGTVTLYAHNSQNLVSVGQYVSQGQPIALLGSTGYATGCHVHFEVRGARNPFSIY